MRKSLLLIIAAMVLGLFTNAQTTLLQEDFESYTNDAFLVQQAYANGWWTTWSNQTTGGTEDAKISNLQAHGGAQSLLINSAQDDIILKLGNKTSGRYDISFWYFINTGFGGYFNFQHYQNPGIQWANEVYFGSTGSGYILAGGDSVTFTHPVAAWFQLETIVDIDQDSAWFYADGIMVHKWKFSLQAAGTAGVNQLGGIDFYGGAPVGQTASYYFDDVVYTQLASGANPPTINVSTTAVNTNGLNPESFTVTNNGDQDLSFVAYPTYPYSASNLTNTATATDLTFVQSAFNGGLGGFASALTVRCAAKFKPSDLGLTIGQSIYSVLVEFNAIPTNCELQIYDRGSFITPGPGNLLASKAFTVAATGAIQEIILDSPIYIDGNDLWIGYQCDADAATYPLGLDAGPRIAGANWISTGPGWSEYNSTVVANLYIDATLQGSPVKQWLTVAPMSGTVTAAQTQQIDLTFDLTGLPNGNYLSRVVVGSNDPAHEFSNVDVNLSVVTDVNNPALNVGVMTFPNPATQNIHVKSSQTIDMIRVYDINGKLVKSITPNTTESVIEVSGFSQGNYSIEVNCNGNIVKRNIVVNK